MDEFPWSIGEDRVVITARGEAEPAAGRDLQLRLVVLADAATGRIELDPGQVDFVDFAGSRTVAAIHRMAAARGGSVRMVAVSPAAARFFEFTGPRGMVPRILPLPASAAIVCGSGTADAACTVADSTASARLGWRFVARRRSSARKQRRTTAFGGG